MNTAIERALELDERLGEAHAVAGRVYEFTGRPEEAEQAYRRALELSPNFVDTYHWYARAISLSPPRAQKALELTLRGEELDPLSSIVKSQLVYQYIHLGRFDEAEERAKQLLELDPEFAPAYNTMAFVQYIQGRLDQRVVWLRQGIERDRNRANLYFLLASTLRLLDDEDGLLEVRAEFETSFPGHPGIKVLDAGISLYRKDVPAALQQTQDLIAAMGPSLQLQDSLAALHFLNEDYPQAREALELAHPEYFDRKQWRDIMTMDNNQGCAVAWAMINTGDEAMGRDLLDVTIDYLENEAPRYLQHADHFPIGTCYLFQGEVDKALAAWQSFVAHGHVAWAYSWVLDQWWSWDQVPWWKALQGTPRFDALYQQIRDNMHLQRDNLKRLTAENPEKDRRSE